MLLINVDVVAALCWLCRDSDIYSEYFSTAK